MGRTNLNNTTPAAPAGQQNVDFQTDPYVYDATVGDLVRPASAYFPNIAGVNAQTGTSYTLQESDNGKLVTFNNASAVAVTLPHATTLSAKFRCAIRNLGAGTVTLTPTTSTIDLVSSLALTTDQGCDLFSDATNYSTMKGAGSSGSSSPTTTLGDIIYRGASADQRLAGNTTSTKKFLRQTGTGSVSAAPAWDTLVAGDIPAIAESGVTGLTSDLATLAAGISSAITTAETYADTGLALKADKVSITGATKTKITYNAQGIVTAGAQAAAADFSDGTVGTGAIVLKSYVDTLSYPYDVGFGIPSQPGAAAIVGLFSCVRSFSFAANFSGSQGHCLTNPTATATFTVSKISSGVTTVLGTVTVSTGGVFSFATTGGSSQSLIAGDTITLTAPTVQDSTLSNISMTLVGTR